MIIRHSKLSDVSEFPKLLEELGYPCELEDLNTRFTKFLETPGYGVVVCEINTKIVGLVAWSRSNLFVLDKVRYHIEAIIVSKNYRGQGIGQQLMLFVEDVAKGNSPAIVDLTSGLRRAQDGTHEFYNQLGYKNEGYMAKLYLRKEL